MRGLIARRPLRSRMVRLIQDADRGQLRTHIPISLVLIIGLAGWIAAGTVLLMLPGMTTTRISLLDALFTATSASAVTGLSVFPISTTFTRLGQAVIMVQAQIGGMGIMVVVVLLMRLMRRRVSMRDRLTVTSSLGLDTPGNIQRTLRNAVLLMLAIEGAGALLLYLHWRTQLIVAPGDAAFYAIFHTVMAFCNAGFDLFSGLPQYPEGIPGDPITLVLLGVLIVTGGLGIPVIASLLSWRPGRRRLSLHARIILYTTAFLILTGAAGLLLSEYRIEGVLLDLSFPERLTRALFQSISARTAGFAGFTSFGAINEESQILLMVLMFIGTGPASMGGGVTIGTFAVLGLAVWSYASGYQKIRAGERTIATVMAWRAAAVLMIGLAVVLGATWLILLFSDLTLGPVLFEVVSAFSTTGLSLGITDKLNVAGKLILILVMFWGRLGAATIIFALAQRHPSSSLVDYPEEPVLVG